jgi:hypothetical protein
MNQPAPVLSYTVLVSIVILSVVLQLAAAIFALRLIKLTERRKVWLFIALACCLQAFRRGVTLAGLLKGGSYAGIRPGDQFIGLVISVCMLAGVALIAPLFRQIKLAEQQVRDTVREKEAVIVKLNDALAKVKMLSGLIPICSSCKRVRNDKGYWQQVETYIRDHSDAQFTHGFCPECEQAILAEAEKNLGKNTENPGG